MLGAALGRRFGPGFVPRAIETIGKWIFLIAFSPFLLILLVTVASGSLFAALREYLKTGQWPRNESFIARMKARRRTAPP
jgi:hypothetical protein